MGQVYTWVICKDTSMHEEQENKLYTFPLLDYLCSHMKHPIKTASSCFIIFKSSGSNWQPALYCYHTGYSCWASGDFLVSHYFVFFTSICCLLNNFWTNVAPCYHSHCDGLSQVHANTSDPISVKQIYLDVMWTKNIELASNVLRSFTFFRVLPCMLGLIHTCYN